MIVFQKKILVFNHKMLYNKFVDIYNTYFKNCIKIILINYQYKTSTLITCLLNSCNNKSKRV